MATTMRQMRQDMDIYFNGELSLTRMGFEPFSIPRIGDKVRVDDKFGKVIDVNFDYSSSSLAAPYAPYLYVQVSCEELPIQEKHSGR